MSFALCEQVYQSVVLPTTEKALLAYLAFKANNDGSSIYPGLESMMTALNLKKWQTLNLLRKLKEKGYIVQVNAPGPRHLAVYRIPLNKAGTIAPQPIPVDVLEEEKEKRRRVKKVQLVADTVDMTEEEEAELLHQAAASSGPLTPIPESMPDYADGYTPRQLQAVTVEEVSLADLIATQEAKIKQYKRMGGKVSARLVAEAQAELLVLQQQQRGYAT